jgi:MFS family permease
MLNKPKELSSIGILLLVAGQILPQINFSIVNVALDVIGHALKTDATGLVLIVSLYGLSFAALIATGRLGDKYGRKRLFMIGTAGFCIASAICGFATDIISMLSGRLLQGFFAALLLPQILATIHATLRGTPPLCSKPLYSNCGSFSRYWPSCWRLVSFG